RWPRDWSSDVCSSDLTDITLVGRLTGHGPEARRVVEEIQARMQRVRQAVGTLPQEKRVTVFYEVYDAPLMTVGHSTILGQLLEKIGRASCRERGGIWW